MILAKPLKRKHLQEQPSPKFDTGPEPNQNRFHTELEPNYNRKVMELKGKLFTKIVLLTVYYSHLIDAWEVNQLIREFAKRKNYHYIYSDADTGERLKKLVDSGLLDRIKIGKSYRYYIRFTNWEKVRDRIRQNDRA